MKDVPLNVLILEDRPADAELMVEALRKDGFAPKWRRVDTERDYAAALDPDLDVILADHSLPQYDSVRALDRLQKSSLDVPFIIVSGTISEELAVSLMKQGAADYVLKDRLARLGQAAFRALERKRLRGEKQRALQQLRDNEAWFRALTDNIHDCIVVLDAAGKVLYSSSSSLRLMGYAPAALLGTDGFGPVHPDDLPEVVEQFQALLADPGKLVQATVRSRHADGSWHWLEVIANNRLAEPPIHGIVLTYRDVTERKKVEEQLLLQGAALEAAANSIVLTDRHGTIAWVNKAFSRMTGYALEEVIGGNPRLLKSGEQDASFYKDLWSTILAGKTWHGELINRRKDGSLYSDEMTITPVCAKGNGVSHFIAIKQDVTERRKTEAALHASEAKLRAIGMAALDAITMIDSDGNVLFWNPAAEAILGYAPTEIVGRNLHSLLAPPRYQAELTRGLAAFRQTGQGPVIGRVMEISALHRDGHEFPVEASVSAVRLDGQWCAVGVLRDITERKRTEAEKNRLAAIIEATPDFVGTTSADERGLYLNRGGREMLGIRLDEKAAALCIADTHPAWAYRLIKEEGIPEAVRKGHWRGEAALRARDGREIPVLMSLIAHKSPTGEAEYVSIVAHDISERKRAEQELLRSEERFRRITTNMLDLVVQVNVQGIYEYVTPSVLSVLGYREEDMIGKSLFPLLHPDYLGKATDAFKTVLETGAPSYGEYRFRKASGEYIWLEVVGNRLLDNDGHVCGVLIASRDVTARRRAEDEIRKLNAELEQKVHDRTAQLEAANKELESFAYSVSHDLRAPLRGIDGFSQALLEDYNDKLDAQGQDYLRRVRAASQRMGRLIDDILQLSRMTRSAMNRVDVDLSAIATRVVAELQSADPARHVDIHLTPALTANGDAHLLEVVLTNLLGNAWKFTSKTANARIEFSANDHEGERTFFVRDNGAGFDMAYAARLFGAFQRLHGDAEFPGTGIGLATVQRIIRRHGGQIWAEGTVDKGATFFFTLGPTGGTP